MSGESFAYYQRPKSLVTHATSTVAPTLFEIGPWLAPYNRHIAIPANHTLPATLMPDTLVASLSPSASAVSDTTQEQYLTAVEKIIESCRKRNGKTVFSRTISGQNPALRPVEVFRRLCTQFPDAFCFLFSTPETGCWMGATPETLLNFDYRTRRVETMAYAGTRPNAGEAPWDEKNIQENLFVADYIVECFRQLGIEPEVSAPYSSPYANLQHLRRDITAILPEEINFTQLLDLLNPTPALCGVPRDAAIADINRYETSPRECYGGFIALHRPGIDFRSLVCLRCARLYPDGTFRIHAGGGITPSSTPLHEYLESSAKASPLLHLLSR